MLRIPDAPQRYDLRDQAELRRVLSQLLTQVSALAVVVNDLEARVAALESP